MTQLGQAARRESARSIISNNRAAGLAGLPIPADRTFQPHSVRPSAAHFTLILPDRLRSRTPAPIHTDKPDKPYAPALCRLLDLTLHAYIRFIVSATLKGIPQIPLRQTLGPLARAEEPAGSTRVRTPLVSTDDCSINGLPASTKVHRYVLSFIIGLTGKWPCKMRIWSYHLAVYPYADGEVHVGGCYPNGSTVWKETGNGECRAKHCQ